MTDLAAIRRRLGRSGALTQKPTPKVRKAKRRPKAKTKAAKPKLTVVPSAPVIELKPRRKKLFTGALTASAFGGGRRRRTNVPAEIVGSPFGPAMFPPAVEKAVQAAQGQLLANDSALSETSAWAGSFWENPAAAAFEEGQSFAGYQYLALLAQRPEYRKIVDRTVTEMTRKWITLQVASGTEHEGRENGDPMGGASTVEVDDDTTAQDAAPGEQQDPMAEAMKALGGAMPAPEEEEPTPEEEEAKRVADERAQKLKAIADEMERLKVKEVFGRAAAHDGYFGRGHIFIDLGDEDPAELIQSIGDGTAEGSKLKVNKNKPVKALRNVEPVWLYPQDYNTANPLSPFFYRPQSWIMQGVRVHGTRLLTFVGREVPDLIKPAYAFGGLALTQMAKPYVDNWLRTRQSVSDLIHSFSTSGIKTNLQGMLEDGGQEMFDRADFFNATRDNRGLFMLDKETEEFFQYNAPLGTLDALQAQAQEQCASVVNMPLVIYLGITPKGLNASSEGEIRVFYDWINAYQEHLWGNDLRKVINLIQLSLFDAIDPAITFKFETLWSMTAKERAETNKIEAETDTILIDAGVVAPEESRERVAADPDSGYSNLDVDDLPEPPQPPMPPGGADPFGGGTGGGPGEGDAPGAQDEAQWNETDHPRDRGGKFSSGGGGAGGGAAPKAGAEKQTLKAPQYGMPHGHFTASGGQQPSLFGGGSGSFTRRTNIGSPISTSSMKKVGGQKGSNPGGVYEDADGKQFYVKKGKSKDHVKNEMIAAALYDLAGTPTLKYRPVEGDEHIATEMAKLDKDNVSKLSDEERKEAARDFAVHAWLGNWDAVGLGGDNLGTVKGTPTALDLGGALEYRAQGAPKGKAFGTSVGELDTLRDAKINKDAAGVFGDMTPAEMRKSARFVTGLSDDRIRKTVEKMGGDKALADKLIARKNDIAVRARMFGAEGDPKKATSTMIVPVDTDMPIKELNGVPFKPWRAPADWASVEGQADIGEPEFKVSDGKKAASGVIIREPDGRLWLVQPRGGYGGYEATFPKGGVEEGLSLQANAIKEAYEESGLKVRIVGHAGDHDGDMTTTRYYYAEREGGTPSKHEDESEGVVLVPKAKAADFLNRKRDRSILLAQDEGGQWEESKHPRDSDGKFASGAGGASTTHAEVKKYSPQFWSLFSNMEFNSNTPLGNGEAIVKAAATTDATAEAALAVLSPAEKTVLQNKYGSIEAAWEYYAKEFLATPPDNPLTNLQIENQTDKVAPSSFKTKKEHIAHLLSQPNGTTTSEVLKATGWPAVSMPQQAAAIGVKLVKWKENGVWKFKGEPMTDADKTAAQSQAEKNKNAAAKATILAAAEKTPDNPDLQLAAKLIKENEVAKAVEVAKAAPAPKPKPEPAKPSAITTNFPPPTPQELEKAKKTVALQLQFVPAAQNLETPQGKTEAQKLVDAFNEKWANKTIPSNDVATQKVHDFKVMDTQVTAIKAVEAQKKHEWEAQQKVEAAKKAAELKAKQEAEAKAAAEANKQVMADLGINEAEALGFNALVSMLGGNKKDVVASFKSYEQKAQQYGYPISGFQAALISNYTNGGYSSVNAALRSGSWSVAQNVYVKMVNKALAKMPTYKGVAQRGAQLTAEQQARYVEGNIKPEEAFMSTSVSKPFGGNTKFVVTAIGKRGAHVKKLSNHASEDEVLFAARTLFHVTKVEGKPGGSMTIHMTEWEDDDSLR